MESPCGLGCWATVQSVIAGVERSGAPRAGGSVSGATNSSTSRVGFGGWIAANRKPRLPPGPYEKGWMEAYFGVSFFISSFFSFLWALWLCFALASSFLSIGLSILSIDLQAGLSWANAND